MVISIFLIAILVGCKNETLNDKLDSKWYDIYELKDLYYSSGSYSVSTPIDSEFIYLRSQEDRDFFEKCKSLFGMSLQLSKDVIIFSGLNEDIKYKVITSDNEGFDFKFDNIFGEQKTGNKEFITHGTAFIWIDYETKKIRSRVINIECSLFLEKTEDGQFKPTTTFKFSFYKNYN